MERRPHPTHDRVTWRRILAGFALAWVTFAFAWGGLHLGAGDWVVWPAGAGLLVGLAIVLTTPVNRATCPSCGETLSRAPDTNEFACPGCNVVWVTRSFGWGLRG